MLDIEEVAQLLQLTMPQLLEIVEDLPSFEVAGRLRFRKERILEWIDTKEEQMRWSRDASALRAQKKKIIRFPGVGQ